MSSRSIVWGTRINFSCGKINIVKNIGCVCVVCILCATAAYAAGLIGTWTGTEDTGAMYTFVFDAGSWSMTDDAGAEWCEGTYTYNDNADPGLLDLYVTDSAYPQFIGQTALYIYKIEGDTLTLTGSDPGSDYRPSGFSEGGATRTFVVVNENPVPDDDTDDTHDSNDNNVKVYVNCFIGEILE